MQSSKQGTEKGHHLSIEGIRNIVGTFFLPKIGYKRVKSWTSGVEPPQDASVQIKQESIFYHAYFISE